MHQTIDDFTTSLRLEGRETTAAGYRHTLHFYDDWLRARGLDALRVTTDQIREYQRWLAEEYRSPGGQPLSRGSQVTRLSVVKSFYAWLERRGLVVRDPSAAVRLPRVPKGMVRKDHLDLQEATALLQTAARHVQQFKEGSYRWARELQGLALLCTAIATGRRRTALRNLRVPWVNVERNEIRYERDKAKPGRVLPVTPWAMSILALHLGRGRPILDWHRDNDHLFVGRDTPRLGANTIGEIFDQAYRDTVAENPDLTELAAKRITPHSFRVSYATLLFGGGCTIRSVNELLDHASLSQTARYCPLGVEDMRRVCRTAHPRA
jgi:integrase/recombinase XerD